MVKRTVCRHVDRHRIIRTRTHHTEWIKITIRIQSGGGGRYVAALPPSPCFLCFSIPCFCDLAAVTAITRMRIISWLRFLHSSHLCALLTIFATPSFLSVWKRRLHCVQQSPGRFTTFVRVCNEASSSGLALQWFVSRDQFNGLVVLILASVLASLGWTRFVRSEVTADWFLGGVGVAGLFSGCCLEFLFSVFFFLLLRYVERQCAICVALLWFQPLEASIFSPEVILWEFCGVWDVFFGVVLRVAIAGGKKDEVRMRCE